MDAEGLWGRKRTERAVRMAVQNATVVKKPKVFCTLTTVECIFLVPQDMILAQGFAVVCNLMRSKLKDNRAREHLAYGRHIKRGQSGLGRRKPIRPRRTACSPRMVRLIGDLLVLTAALNPCPLFHSATFLVCMLTVYIYNFPVRKNQRDTLLPLSVVPRYALTL